MNPQPNADYVLARNTGEYRRLLAQAETWAPATRSALQRAGLASGMHALDVGCGPGTVMRLMGEVVGAKGRVTGLDADAALAELALSDLRTSGPDIYDFVAGDIGGATSVDDRRYDFVFARLLLLHAPDPLAMLQRLWGWVKPGGVLLVMDYDMTGIRVFPPHEVAQRGIDLLRRLFLALGRDIEIGTRMPELMRRAGLGLPDGCDVASYIGANVAGAPTIRAVLAGLRDASLKGGHADAHTLDAIDAELAAIPEHQFFARLSDMVSTWKRKPA